MIPLLFAPDDYNFNARGLGPLNMAVSCIVTEEINGIFELSMQYPATAKRGDMIRYRSIILATPGPDKQDRPQPFRVYRIRTNIKGIMTINARHVAFDASGIPVKPFTAAAAGAKSAMEGINSNEIEGPGHIVIGVNSSEYPDGDTTFSLKSPCSARAAIKQALDIYGGELDYDWDAEPFIPDFPGLPDFPGAYLYSIKTELKKSRGSDNGKSIRYGVDLADYNQDEDNSNFYTGVYPFWAGYVSGWFGSKSYKVVTLGDNYVTAAGEFDFTRLLVVDFSSEFDSNPSTEKLKKAAQDYIAKNNIGVPSFGLAVKQYAIKENKALGDTIRVYYPKIGVSAKARIVSLTWDVLRGKTTDLQIGSIRASLADTVARGQTSIADLSAVIYHRTNTAATEQPAAETTTTVEGGTVSADGQN